MLLPFGLQGRASLRRRALREPAVTAAAALRCTRPALCTAAAARGWHVALAAQAAASATTFAARATLALPAAATSRRVPRLWSGAAGTGGCRFAALLLRATRRGAPPPPSPPPRTPPAEDVFADFPGGDESLRAWNALTKDTRSLIRLLAGFFVLPVVISASLRAALIEPLLFLVQADTDEISLTTRQWDELTERVERTERRLRYDARMGRAPALTEAALDARLREEGQRLEEAGRLAARAAVGNSLSDALGFVLLLSGFWVNRGRLMGLRDALAGRFLALGVSTQAFVLLLVADVLVGYHSSDGWITACEVLVERYNVDGAEAVETLIRLTVAVVPVVLDVSFKYWVYKSLRKLSPGTQIILSEARGGGKLRACPC